MTAEAAVPTGEEGEGRGASDRPAPPAGSTAIPFNPDGIPDQLQELHRWVAFKLKPKPNSAKFDKIPINPATGKHARSTDSATWGTFEQALLRMRADRLPGLGFVLNGDGIAAVDIDGCRDSETGELDAEAGQIILNLNSFSELSVSGSGVHVFLRGELPPGRRKGDRVEMYETGRFIAMTGVQVPGTPNTIGERQDEITNLHARVFCKATEKKAARPAPGSDDALLDRARRARNGDKFKALWSGDTSGYESDSEADLALCAILAHWAHGDPEAVDRLFRRSGLMRPK